MKKCPECGNPSYDGAPKCGNCGYKFPMKTRKAPKKETDIFADSKKAETKKVKKPKVEKPKKATSVKKPEKPKSLKPKNTKDESTIEIIKQNKFVIGIIVAVTIIAICGIVLSGSNSHDSTPAKTADTMNFSEYGFSFSFPKTWNQTKLTDESHETAIFFDAGNNTIVEFYNVTSDYKSLKQINQERITKAQNEGDYIDTVETLTLDGRNSSNIIIENADGDYTRYVSLFTDGELYVFKITGESLNNVNSTAINDMVSTAHIS
ncbi:MAG: zinc ribbon domain-containing protein [Methanobrevibacter sp.]|uniref:zinc ribbon domain-containing protein n=1 Tax=Methanobrevibacter sp. TaxID=66852 RepID=UPI0026DF15BC|nr:zinc ribbon domain-containing protein [Methanobrevibacter sp.]MDO5848960.1 zinc ribbon domain-containing protein [Methanobrevibacter sp.]